MIFKFNKPKSTQDKVRLISEEHEINGAWYLFFTLSKNDQLESVSKWNSVDHEGASWIVSLQDADVEELKVVDGTQVGISVEKLRELIKGRESYFHRILELPEMFDGGIEIVGRGLLHNDDFRLDWYWNSGSGKRLTCDVRESVIEVGGKKYWLPEHAYELSKQLSVTQAAINSECDLNDKLLGLEAFQRLLNLLPEEESIKVEQTSNLSGLKLFYANSFRIEALPDGDSFSIKPVLLRKREADSRNTVFEALLTPADQERYGKFFAQSTKLLPHYSFDGGKYIIVNDKVNKALGIVHKVQHASAEERKEFLKNPKAKIEEHLGETFEDGELEGIFSDRVIGIGAWQAKVIPWIKIPSQDWLPTGELPEGLRGLAVGDEKFELSEKQAGELVERVEKALEKDKPTVRFLDKEVPASNETLSAIKEIFPEIPIKPTNYQSPKNLDVSKAEPNVSVMLVKENLESVQFAVYRNPRKNVPINQGLPVRTKSKPKAHQREAFNWLCEHYRVGSRGVLLADDMGLGKTFQSLIFLAWLKEAMEAGEISQKPLLIIAPTGLLKNWEAEIGIHLSQPLGHLVRAYDAGIQQLKINGELDTSALRRADLVLTTYETLNRYQTAFSAIAFSAIVLDEAQKLKNPGTRNYSAVASLNADFWLGMTGTPIENRLSDLWSIADLLQPGMLGSIKEFSNRYEKVTLESAEDTAARLSELQDGLAKSVSGAPAFMMRRMKSDQLPDLPKKELHFCSSPMPDGQSALYTQIVTEAKRAKGTGGTFFETLHKIRACSLHPDYKREATWKDDEFIYSSARLKSCFDVLDKAFIEKDKVLIFIEYNDWHNHDFLPGLIQRRYKLAHSSMTISGKVNSAARQKRVEEFQKNRDVFDVMLLSPKAGGVGLTLTAANHVVHLTRWWNPAVEDQATDRVYRIGQQKTVHIHFPLAVHPEYGDGSFDVILNQILEKKRGLREQALISLPPNTEEVESMLAKGLGIVKETASPLVDSYTFSGQYYEDFVLRKLSAVSQHFGFAVYPTKNSWDGGADMIVQTNDGEIVAVIQCKHVSAADKTPSISPDLERAMKSYGCLEHIKKIGITNASKCSKEDADWLRKSANHAILSGENGLEPAKIFAFL